MGVLPLAGIKQLVMRVPDLACVRIQVVTPIGEMEAAFDPAKPLTFVVEYDTVPPLQWKRSYKDISVTIQ